MYKSIRQSIEFAATPAVIYGMLMNSEKHSAFTGAPATVNSEVGGKSSYFGGGINAINLELVPNQRIVQMWRAGNWPEGHYSTITYELSEAKDGVQLAFTQTGVPEENHDEISKGWVSQYWDKMKVAV